MSTLNSPTRPARYQWMGAICAILTFAVIATLHTSTLKTNSSIDALVVSLASLLLFFPLLRRPKAKSPHRGYQQTYAKTVAGLLLLTTLWTLFQYLSISRSMIGGVDWFYYLCYSRDIVNGYPVSDNIHSYFPGVYVIWTWVMRLAGQDLATLQSFYQMSQIVACLLTGWIVKQHTHSRLLAGFAAVWTFVLVTKFDGLTGVTESLAIIPWLIGLAVWKGQPIDRAMPIKRLLLFGVLLGWTVFMKQQAGLLCLGFLFLLFEQRMSRHHWKSLLSLPAIAVVTLLLSVLILGDGLKPISLGLKTAAAYGSEQSWLSNLYTQFRHDESLWIATILAGVLFFKRSSWLPQAAKEITPTDRVVGFALLAFIATLIQFKARPYHHYMLLGIPSMVLTCTLVYARYQNWLTESSGKRVIVGVLLILPCIWCAPYNDSYHPLRLQIPEGEHWIRQHNPANNPVLQSISESLGRSIPAESRLLILPGRYNSIHYTIESLSDKQTGYNFNTQLFGAPDDSWLTPIRQTEAEFVLLLTGDGLARSEHNLWSEQRIESATRLLSQRGYKTLPNAIDPANGLLFRKQ